MGLWDWLNPFSGWGEAFKVGHDAGKAVDREVSEAIGDIPVVGNAINVIGDSGQHSFESALTYARWLYDNAVSQPISTVILQGNKVQPEEGTPGWGSPGALFSGAQWARSWRAAEHISPGQALLLRGATTDPSGQLRGGWQGQAAGAGVLGVQETARSVEAAGLAYLTPDRSLLPEGFDRLSFEEQQQLLRDQGLPVSGNAAVERLRRQSPFYRYGSGTVDFALNWYADPLVVAGKAVGAARRANFVTPIKLDWGTAEIQTLVNSSRVQRVSDWIWANRDNPQLINSLDLVERSAIGPRFGNMVAQMQSRTELDDLLRVGWGDEAALETLKQTNSQLAARVEQSQGRLAALDLAHSRVTAHGNTRAQAMIEQRMAQLETAMNADKALYSRYEATIGQARLMDSVNISYRSIQRAENRAAARAGYQAGRARRASATGQVQEAFATGGLPKARVLTDYFGTPMTVVRAFGNYKPNGWMPLDDITKEAITEIRGQIARIPGLGSAGRAQLLNDYLKTNSQAERLAYLEQLDGLTVERIAGRYGFSAEDARALMAEHQRRRGLELSRLRAGDLDEKSPRYSAADRPHPDQPGVMIKADNFLAEGGALHVAPNMRSKLQNHHQLVDADEWLKVLSRHGSAIRALRDSAGRGKDWVDDAADYLNTVWKFGTLFRLGYIPRTVGDDIAGQTAALGAAAMALRVGYGVKNAATNWANRSMRGIDTATVAARQEGVRYIDDEIRIAEAELASYQSRIDNRLVRAERRMLTAERVLQKKQNALNNLNPRARRQTRNDAQNEVLKWETELRRAQRSWSQLSRPGRALTAHHFKALDLERRIGYLGREKQRALDEIASIEKRTPQNLRPWKGSPKDRNIEFQGRDGWTFDGMKVPGAFEGERGDFYLKSISSDESMARLFGSNKAVVHGNIMRSFDHGGVIVDAIQNEGVHARAWVHAINAQIMQDQLGRLAVDLLERHGPAAEHVAVPEMVKWLKGAQGSKYRQDIGIKFDTEESIAASAWAEVNHYLPHPDMIAKAKELDGVNTAFLQQLFPDPVHRPQVHAGQLNEVFGSRPNRRALDRVMEKWYTFAATIPADRLSRHPLFNQLYEGHANRLLTRVKLQNGKITQESIDREVAEQARRLARRDMQKLVFDIAHKSDAVSALRFVSPFLGATTESWQRWARIIADKPQTVGYAAKFFNTPLALGHAVDKDGNVIAKDGYVTDPVTGERRLVRKTDRLILARMPKWLANGPIGVALGVDTSGKWLISQDSANLVLTGDPWFNPGVGPMVQIPVSSFVKDKPDVAEVARHLGVLPFGPNPGGPLEQVTKGFLPRTVQDFLTTWDTSDERYQSVRLHFIQKYAYEAENLNKPMPSLKEIDRQVKQYWLFSAASAFLRPVATTKQDPYQFYRDQYNNLLRKNGDPRQADQEFIDRYGESFLVFAQSQSQNASGVQATKKAAKLYEKYRDIIDTAPDLAPLIIGPEGNGPFSPEAYSYQLNSPIVSGGSDMQREKISADEAMRRNKERRGWARYTATINQLNAQAVARGGKTYEDFEDLKTVRKAAVLLLTNPSLPDGNANPFYNEQFAEAWTSLDTSKYERLIPQLEKVAFSPLAQNRNRSDLQALQQYLQRRRLVVQMLQQSKAAGGSGTLSSQQNAGIRKWWTDYVGTLIEQDLGFGDLHSRYLSRDLDVDVEETQ